MGLILPFAGLVLGALALPFVLARVLPEGVAGLVANGVLSAFAMTIGAAGYFLWAYARQDTRVVEAIGLSPGDTLGYFLRLGVGAGLIWGPVLALSLSAQPRRWKRVQW